VELKARQSSSGKEAHPVPDFDTVLERHGCAPITRDFAPHTLQINVGKLCNQACHHCHVNAGPKRTEIMTSDTARRVTELLRRSSCIRSIDITGGAPELNPHFTFLVERARALERSVIVRCNLTVMFEPGMEWLGEFYWRNQVALVCSLPCYGPENVDNQRGRGVFCKSVEALRRLNRLGYGRELRLDLVYNPVGPFLPPSQKELEARYRDELGRNFGIEFHRLLTITNMPINRFALQLKRWGKFSQYMGLLVNHFNREAVDRLMCKTLVSVGWDGRLYDCDFNQMLDIPIGATRPGTDLTIWDIDDVSALMGARVATGSHCFGCTAGMGSSCGGALV
jgi:radical SAM/Cys-rich protein